MNRLRYYPIFLILIILIFIGCASTAPLPKDLSIFEAPPNTPPQSAAFLGIWEGKWSGGLDTILVVSKISNDNAEVIHSLGDQGGAFIYPQNDYWNIVAKINNGTIEWTQTNGHKFVFEMDSSQQKLKGYFIDSNTGGKLWTFLKKVEFNDFSKSKIYYYRYPPSRAIFTTGLNQDNGPIDNVEKISLKTKRIYLYITWFDLVLGRHEYKAEIYDGAGNLVRVSNMNLEPDKTIWYTWSWYDIQPVDQAGTWKFKVYFDNKLAVTRELQVLDE